MESAFLGAAYTLRSLPLAAQTCVNLYVEQNEKTGGGAFYGTPGLATLITYSASGARGLHVAGGYLWTVYGNTVFRTTTGWVVTEVGTLPNDSGAVRIFDNGIDLIVAHQDGWHTCLVAGGALSAVAGSEGTSDGCFIDSYVVQAKEDGTYQWATVGTTTIDPLSFASAEGSPDKIVATFSDHRELLLFGENTIEVAQVTGDADLPFTRTAFMEQGCLAKQSIAKADNSVFFLGKNDRGQGIVYRLDGYNPTRISDYGIELAIAGYATPSGATAFTYQQDGHHFYVISFAEGTWAYDLNTGLWAQRAYRNTSTGELERHRGACHAFFNGVHVLGDHENGKLYRLDPEVYTDAGDDIYRERTWAQISDENQWLTFARGELIAEMGVGLSGAEGTGTNPVVRLAWSDDRCRTWSQWRDRTLGAIGEYKARAIWYRLGKSRHRAFKLSSSAPVKHVWMGFNIQ